MRNKVIFFLLMLLGLFFTYLAITDSTGVDLTIGYALVALVALVAFINGYIVLKKSDLLTNYHFI